MKRLSLLVSALLAAVALLGTACDGDDDADGGNDGTATEVAGDGSETGGSDANGDAEFFQINGTGVLTLVLDGETYEFDVTCQADKGKTLGDEPQWDYSIESDDAEVVVQGTYQLVNGQETFKSLLVTGSGVTVSAQEFSNVTSGGTEWAGSFTAVGATGPIEGTFETSCS